MRCYWVKDREIGRVHIPGCWGAALGGPKNCTCGAAGTKRAMEQEIEELKRRVVELERAARAVGQ